MPEEQTEEKKAPKTFDELKGKIEKKEKVSRKDLIQQFATRAILEDDYKKDILDIVFESAPGVYRKIKAKRPTPEQMTEIIQLSIESSLLETRTDAKSKGRMSSIFTNLSEIAGKLCIDRQLNKDFWNSHTSSYALSSFIGEIIKFVSQGPLTEGELTNFRG